MYETVQVGIEVLYLPGCRVKSGEVVSGCIGRANVDRSKFTSDIQHSACRCEYVHREVQIRIEIRVQGPVGHYMSKIVASLTIHRIEISSDEPTIGAVRNHTGNLVVESSSYRKRQTGCRVHGDTMLRPSANIIEVAPYIHMAAVGCDDGHATVRFPPSRRRRRIKIRLSVPWRKKSSDEWCIGYEYNHENQCQASDMPFPYDILFHSQIEVIRLWI